MKRINKRKSFINKIKLKLLVATTEKELLKVIAEELLALLKEYNY